VRPANISGAAKPGVPQKTVVTVSRRNTNPNNIQPINPQANDAMLGMPDDETPLNAPPQPKRPSLSFPGSPKDELLNPPESHKQAAPQRRNEQVENDDPQSKLRKYREMLEDGLISQKEFTAKREEILTQAQAGRTRTPLRMAMPKSSGGLEAIHLPSDEDDWNPKLPREVAEEDDPIRQLRILKRLLDSGHISKDEYLFHRAGILEDE
jgi:hypothetical protein